ncbi:MAG: hypothetical protein EBS19_00290 [Spirochaetia bacterium]|nr:hypothetical protein [Spirochaetia bacterium]
MRVYAKTIIIALAIIILNNCGGAKTEEAVMSLVPIALQGGVSPKAYNDPKSPSTTVSQSVVVDDPALYTTTDSPVAASCVGGVKNPGSSFGNTKNSSGAVQGEATFSLCSPTDVDRFKSIEILFSQPMDTKSVESAFSISGDSGQLPGPSPKGIFTWLSPTRLIFDPYVELGSRETYTVRILSSALTLDGNPFKEFSDIFTTSHNFALKHTLKQGSITIPLGTDKDVTFDKTAGNIILNSEFLKPTGAFEEVSSIVFNRLGNIDNKGNPLPSAKIICNDPCSFLGTPINLNTDIELQSDDMKLRDGGNTYYFEIRNKSGKVFNRYISFNWGTINKNPNGLIKNVASGVLDQTQMLKMLERLIEVFTQAKFKVNGKSFVDFANENISNAKNKTVCIDYQNFNFIKTYGDNPNGGYCGPSGDKGAFIGHFSQFPLGTSDFNMDVYITSVSIPGYVNNVPTIDAGMNILDNNKVGIDLNGRKAIVGLAVIAENVSDLGAIWPLPAAIPAGTKFYFTTSAELNKSVNPDLRQASAKTSISVDANGVLGLGIKLPFTPQDTQAGNFYVDPWVVNLGVNNMVFVSCTTAVCNIPLIDTVIGWLSGMIADGMVPQVKPNITQAMLTDIVQKVAPNVLNSIVGTLKSPGVDVSLPSYLPAGLANFGLNAKVQLSDDATVRVNGNNKGLISSIHLGITAKSPIANPHLHANTTLCANGCFISTKDPNVPLVNPATSAPFLESSARPGFLLSLHPDLVTQAAYHMWKNRVIDLNIDKTFIQSVNAYAGSDPLLKLTEQILKASAIMSILAPGKTSLQGLDSNGNLLPPICSDDDIVFAVNPIMVPATRMISNQNVDPNLGDKPIMNMSISDMQMTVMGKRTDNSDACKKVRGNANGTTYILSVLRVNMNANATFKFVEFDNPNTPSHDRLNSLSIKMFTDGLKYSMEVMEDRASNPYGLDPAGIRSALNPLVTSLVVPLVNSILNKVPLPDAVAFPALNYPSSSTACKISAKTDNAIKFTSLPVPASDAVANPYIYGRVELVGLANTDPVNILEQACR